MECILPRKTDFWYGKKENVTKMIQGAGGGNLHESNHRLPLPVAGSSTESYLSIFYGETAFLLLSESLHAIFEFFQSF